MASESNTPALGTPISGPILDESTASTVKDSPPTALKEDLPQDATPSQLPSRVKTVFPRELCHFKSEFELVYAMKGAISAHKAICERADGELHGDINTNTILIIGHPPLDRPSEGALIYWEPPLTIQTLRKMGKREPPAALLRSLFHCWC